MSEPKVSVIMPTKNAGKYIRKSMQCLARQKFRDFEIIIKDAESTDGTLDIVDEVAEEDGLLIKKISGQDSGIGHALEILGNEARGEFLMFHPSDDYLFPNAISDLVRKAESDSNIGLVYGNVLVAYGNFQTKFPMHRKLLVDKEALLYRNTVPCVAALARTKIVKEVGGFRKQYRYSEDYDLWLRVSEKSRIETIPKCIGVFRIRPDSLSSTMKQIQFLSHIDAVKDACKRRSFDQDRVLLEAFRQLFNIHSRPQNRIRRIVEDTARILIDQLT